MHKGCNGLTLIQNAGLVLFTQINKSHILHLPKAKKGEQCQRYMTKKNPEKVEIDYKTNRSA